MRQNVLIIDFLNKLKSFYFAHKDKIKTAALPAIVGLAVLFFWFYGSDDQPEIKDNPAQLSAEEAGEAETAGQATVGGDIFVDIDGAPFWNRKWVTPALSKVKI